MKRLLFICVICCLLAGFASSCASLESLLADREQGAGQARGVDKDTLPELQPDLVKDDEPREHDELGRAVSRSSTESLELVNQGKQRLAAGEYISAIDAFTKALTIDGSLADAYYYRAVAYDSEGDYERAVQDFSMTATINPEYVKAYFGRAEVHKKSGNISEAIDDYASACNMGYTAACVERENLTGSLNGARFNEEKIMP